MPLSETIHQSDETNENPVPATVKEYLMERGAQERELRKLEAEAGPLRTQLGDYQAELARDNLRETVRQKKERGRERAQARLDEITARMDAMRADLAALDTKAAEVFDADAIEAGKAEIAEEVEASQPHRGPARERYRVGDDRPGRYFTGSNGARHDTARGSYNDVTA